MESQKSSSFSLPLSLSPSLALCLLPALLSRGLFLQALSHTPPPHIHTVCSGPWATSGNSRALRSTVRKPWIRSKLLLKQQRKNRDSERESNSPKVTQLDSLTPSRGLFLLCASVMSDSATLRTTPHRPLCPWDSPGKNTGVGFHPLLQVWPTNQTCVSYKSPALAGRFFTISHTWEVRDSFCKALNMETFPRFLFQTLSFKNILWTEWI